MGRIVVTAAWASDAAIAPTRALYSAAQTRELDRLAIGGRAGAGYALMQAAAAAAWRALRDRRPELRRVDVVCGPGNNGGDGYELARLAWQDGVEARVWAIGTPAAGTEADQACAAWQAVGHVGAYEPGVLDGADAIVDALYGTGLSRPVEGLAAEAIADIRAQRHAYVMSIDIPSGLHADTGRVLGMAVMANLTISFIGRKIGLYTGLGPEYAGERLFDDLGVAAPSEIGPLATLLDQDDLLRWLPPRRRGAHKGDNGFVLLIGGDRGYAGAIVLAARAALRSGSGRVAVATRSAHASALVAGQPEVMFRGVESVDELLPLMAQADVVAIGPGLGREAWGRAMWSAALASSRPLVVDADALNLLAEQAQHRDDWVLTPHPGEAARLLQTTVAAVEADRISATRALVARYGGTVVLKGAGSLIGDRSLAVCPYGNPGMAVGGAGDVLTGIVASVMAQAEALSMDVVSAVRCAVLVHALAGDRAAQRIGERGLLPSDLIDALPAIVNPCADGGRV